MMILLMLLLTSIVFYIYLRKRFDVILNILQIDSYENKKTIEVVRGRINRKKKIKEFILLLPLFFLFFNLTNYMNITFLLVQLSTIVFLLVLFKDEKNKQARSTKKPLVNTERMKRIKLVNLIFIMVTIVLSLLMYLKLNDVFSFNFKNILTKYGSTTLMNIATTIQLIVYTIVNVLSVYVVTLSNVLLKPVEKRINNKYINEAKEKLESMPNLKVIGITGSFGKTSTKYILDGLLSYKYNVCKTQGSYNTTLGVVRTIRENLKLTDEIFIAEMGARHINDIKEICDIVHPQYGIITAIGNQHLETFKSVENIKQAKYELVRGLEGKKLAFLNADNEHIRDIISKEKLNEMQHETICYSLKDSEADYFVDNIQYNKIGSTFDVHVQKGEGVKITIKLLGIHNIYNTLGAIAIANKLGMSMEEIAKAAARLQPVEHRLQIIKSNNANITVIDDTFNANPEGTKEALEVLKRMEGNKKIIITPGMIELGDRQYTLNLEFGEHCAKTCDYTIMVGKVQTLPMQDAFKNLGIDSSKYCIAKDLNDATSKLQSVLEAGDVILYENDLPEDY